MTKKKLQLILILAFALLLVSTVAYAYAGPQLGSRYLFYGTIGGDVQQLQSILNKDGYSVGTADGIFGPKTQNAVTRFQKNHGLATDGIVGPLTLKALHNTDQSLASILQQKGITAPIPQVRIVVQKSAHLLTLYSGTTPLKSYTVDLGDNGLGDKQVSGDHKTPEGTFYIAQKSVLTPPDQYLGTRWMRLSYPNIEDAQRGLNSGLIDQSTYNSIVSAINNGQIPPQYTALGGGVGIHGGDDNNGPGNWTFGCVGLSNADANEIYNYVAVGTPVIIQH